MNTRKRQPQQPQKQQPQPQQPEILASILSADFCKLGEDASAVLGAGADGLHLDMMDNHFVPNLTFGPMVLAALRKQFPKTLLDVHIMCTQSERLLEDVIAAGADRISLHLEANDHLHRQLSMVKAAGVRAAVAINPASSLFGIENYCDLIDYVLVMTVNPGFAAQKFIQRMEGKVSALRRYLVDVGAEHVFIQVDGGICATTIGDVAQVGARSFVCGNSIFSSTSAPLTLAQRKKEYAQRIFSLKKAATAATAAKGTKGTKVTKAVKQVAVAVGK